LAFTVGVYCFGCMKLFHELFDTVNWCFFQYQQWNSSLVFPWLIPPACKRTTLTFPCKV
jgi:hypothetical protein